MESSNVDNTNETDEGIFVNEDQLAHVILYGEMSNLSALRQAETQSEFLLQRGGEPWVSTPIACRASGYSTDDDENDVAVAGEVFISWSQVLFVAANGNTSKDLAIGATCITLHAMTEEPELSLYLQLTTGDDDDAPSEVTITPLDSEASQVLFDGLCKLVSSHPLEEEDDGEGGEFFGSDDLIWAPSSGAYFNNGEENEEGAATGEERDAMLERLDNLLVVRPEFEIQEGQFEDAEE